MNATHIVKLRTIKENGKTTLTYSEKYLLPACTIFIKEILY